ncbi:DsbA family protein [Limosilactobacillus sp. STM2_1]|uniref:DsbA family protein n=1 Tax=Limosilactobacillus rudii TaxID=2759755 RepID=A0A7W3UJB3_9LACO|nr:DsbA family protein [Limosilactobacillus rudii]MBB1078520.1 DsbA family protein [Limosilactobacillus rudii]MBB1096649.1 DsbA family protein [Limosilactobacillus rudii]MCD7133682.1 DsbA family protein [Limosilactobacillus rudii]
MLELHLFVNPLGMHCLRCEKDVLKIDHDLNTKISYQFVPLFNMKTIDNTIDIYHLNPHDLTIRQRVSKTLNQVILDYKAALFQGRKRGRHYLLLLQSALIKQGLNYSDGLANKIASDSDLDLEMFQEDRQSQLAKQAFRQDQKIASDLGVTETATAVVFNTNDSDYGLMIPNFNYDTLINAFKSGELDSKVSLNDLANSYQAPKLTILQNNN